MQSHIIDLRRGEDSGLSPPGLPSFSRTPLVNAFLNLSYLYQPEFEPYVT